MPIVYLHKKKNTDEVFYVGIGKSLKRAYSKCDRNKYWKSVYQKYGYDVEITHNNICWEEACKIECYLIKFFRQFWDITNMTDGGDGVVGLKVSEERKREYAIRFLGEKNPFFGKKHSEETKIKMSKNNNPRKFISDEHKAKISLSNKNKKRTEEVKRKISEKLKGCKAWNKGISPTEETKEKIRQKVKSLQMDAYKKNISEKTKKAYMENPTIREKLSLKMKGRMSPRKGIKLSDEQKKLLSEINKGKTISEEQKIKISQFHKGRKRSQETKNRISISIKNLHKKRKNEIYNGGETHISKVSLEGVV